MSSKDLFNEQKNHKTISLNLYCDEIKKVTYEKKEGHDKESHKNENWTYVGILLVPTEKEDKLIKDLKEKCYEGRDTDVEYKGTKGGEKFAIAKNMIDYILKNEDSREMVYFYILGINQTALDKKRFGGEKIWRNIYTRFFRTAVLKSAKQYFSKYDNIVIENIYHDKGDLQHHEYFPSNTANIIKKKENKLSTKCDEITFIDSDHKKSKEEKSRFIQLIDVIMGVTANIIHWNSKDEKKTKLGKQLLPLIKRILENPRNKNSRYKYANRLGVEFFPKEKNKHHEKEYIKWDELFNDILNDSDRVKNYFYTERNLKIIEHEHNPLFHKERESSEDEQPDEQPTLF